MRRHCIILAGGEGTRFDNALPKQFLSLGGEPIVVVVCDAVRPFVTTAQLLLRSGVTVMTFPGAQTNFKITTVEDLKRAEALLASRSD